MTAHASSAAQTIPRAELLERLIAVQRPLRQRFRATFPPEARVRLQEAMEQVTAPQVEALMLLREHPAGLSMHELAAAQGSTPSSATQMVDRLIRLGMVERLREQGDRRVVRVQLSASSLERFQEVMVARVRAVEGVTTSLSDAELETLVGLLEKLAR